MHIKHVVNLFAVLFVCGCSSRHSDLDSIVNKLTVSNDVFLTITNGSSLQDVNNRLGIAARHEFTIARRRQTYILISCYFSGANNNAWLLFCDHTLIKIIEPFSFPELVETYPYEGTTATRPKPYNIDDPIMLKITKEVIDAHALTRNEVVADLKPYNGNGSEPLKMAPALLPMFLASKFVDQVDSDYRTNDMLLKRYDGCLANLGMDVENIKKVYGKPLRIITARNGGFAFIYGENRELQVNPQLAFAGLAILFNSDRRVVAIYSDDFFYDGWKK